jgi:hypothetical protein
VQSQRDQIVDLGESGTCPICARPLETHFRTVLDVLDTQIETITVDGKYYRARIEQLAAMPPEVKELDDRRRVVFETVGKLERESAKVHADVQELATVTRDLSAKQDRLAIVAAELTTIAVVYRARRHVDVRALIERLTPLAARAAKLAAQLEREPRLNEERNAVRIRVTSIDARLRELGDRRSAMTFSSRRSAICASARAVRHRAALGRGSRRWRRTPTTRRRAPPRIGGAGAGGSREARSATGRARARSAIARRARSSVHRSSHRPQSGAATRDL